MTGVEELLRGAGEELRGGGLELRFEGGDTLGTDCGVAGRGLGEYVGVGVGLGAGEGVLGTVLLPSPKVALRR
ncbi:MAG: hypothetical protein ACO3AF_02945, partial [Flavobacteriales bacterium]